jgi:hypothetical protein
MSSKWTATSAVVGGALATWLASAATSNHETAPAPVVRTAPIEARGAELAGEIARLHDRLRPRTLPQTPVRNPFSFRSAASRPAPVAAAAAPVPSLFFPVPSAASRPESGLKLSGFAEDPGPDGAIVRTAIISSPTQLYLVKEGETVAARYRVTKLSADAVELADVNSGASLRLVLK